MRELFLPQSLKPQETIPGDFGTTQRGMEIGREWSNQKGPVIWAWKREDRSRETGCFIWSPPIQ